MKFSEATIAIVGVGLMGGSLGQALVSTGACKEVRALVRRDRAVEEVLSSEAAHFAGTDPGSILKGVDLVVLATPVRTIETQVSELRRFLKPGAVITDLGSVKRGIVEAMEGLPGDFHAVGGHPMCGKETSGISAADPNLFHGKVWIMVPTARSSPRALRLVEEMIEATGAERITVSADVHDLLVACTSHLPYLLAATLVNVAEENARDRAELWQVAASGFRDVSRVAASDLTMMTDILCANKDNAVAMLEKARDTMGRLAELLAVCDEQGLRRLLSGVRNRRIAMFRNNRPLVSEAVSHG